MPIPNTGSSLKAPVRKNAPFRIILDPARPLGGFVDFKTASSDKTDIGLYDGRGKRLLTILDSELEAGDHRIRFAAPIHTPGLYFIQLRTSKDRRMAPIHFGSD
jgi:hypothetical protein